MENENLKIIDSLNRDIYKLEQLKEFITNFDRVISINQDIVIKKKVILKLLKENENENN